MSATTNDLRLERETCTRCGGSGRYSHCQMYGDTCFRCNGRKETLTKRGAAAMAHLIKLCSVPARELKPGDVIRDGMLTAGGTPYDAWVKVIAVRPYDNSGSHSYVNGVEQPQRTDLLEVETDKVIQCGVAPETLVRVAQTPARKRELLAQAIEYQNTLTKRGEPRKSR